MKVKNLIIGGGFSGLYLAHILEDATIIESSDSVGGLLRGFKSKSRLFTFDVGGHVYTTKDVALTELMKTSDAKLFDERKAYFDYEKKVPYPLQYHADMLDIPITTNSLQSYASFGSLLIHEFGNEFYEKVLFPFNKRVWGVSPSSMSVDWITGRVPLMIEKSMRWGSNSSFYYAPGNSILEVLQNRLTDVTILVNLKLTSIDIQNKVARVDMSTPYLAPYHGEIQYENLFDTSGFVLNMLRANLPYNHVFTIGIGLNKMIDDDFHWWYNGTNNQSPIHRITLLSRYYDGMAPIGVDSLLVEIPHMTHHSGDEIVASDYHGEENILMIMSMLREAKFHFIEEKDIEEVTVIKSKGYPIPIISHREKVAQARRNMMQNNIYLVGRWGAHGYYNLDHNISDAIYARNASLGLTLDDYLWANYYYLEKRSENALHT